MCLVWGVVYCLLGGNFNSKYKVWAKFSTFTDISFTLSRSNISYFSDISSMCYEILLISSHNTTLTLKILYSPMNMILWNLNLVGVICMDILGVIESYSSIITMFSSRKKNIAPLDTKYIYMHIHMYLSSLYVYL